MVQTRSQSARGRQGLASSLSGTRKAPKPFSQLPCDSAHVLHVRKARTRLAELKAKRKLRVRRLQDQILGPGRVFSGTISPPDGTRARKYDATRLGDVLANIKLGRALVYWTDGAFGGSGTKAGVMGAGVAWHDGSEYFAQSFRLGHGTGNHDDAELFAIAAALGKAKKEVQRGKGVQLVRIYSDSLSILDALRNGRAIRFGPMLSQRTALEGMYERADWLAANGVAVTLIWVKAHSNSEGNRRADKAASAAVREQALLREQSAQARILTEADIPDVWRELGPDWAEEWLFRACGPSPGHPINEIVDIDEDNLSPVTEGHPESEHVLASDEETANEPILPTEQASEAKLGTWDWEQYGYTLPKLDIKLPVNRDVLKAHPAACDPRRRGFVLPEYDRYGNVAIHEVIADLHQKLESAIKDIANLERYIARKASKKSIKTLRAELEQLDLKRDWIASEFQAQTDQLVAQEGGSPRLVKMEEQ